MIFVKKLKFFHLCCLSKIDGEKTIFDNLYSKQAFLNNENIRLKTHKIGIFPKGLVHDVGQKFYFCLRSFYAKYTQKKYLVTFSLENKRF